MPVDPQAQALIDQALALGGPPLSEQGAALARRAMVAGTAAIAKVEPIAQVFDRMIPGPAGEIRIRVYRPEGAASVSPVLVYFHGGGWVLGGIATHDTLCRSLANATGFVVVSVDYRLAPEHPFPAAVDDALAAATWTADNAEELGVDPSKIIVGGDSAGGNLAAAVALLGRDRGSPRPALQVLIYPIVDHDFDTISYRENARGYLLSREDMIWFWDQYAPDVGLRDDPRASPLRAPSVAGAAPALIVVAEFDPLRDEAEAYADRLRREGVPVTLLRYDGMVHGFLRRTALLDRARTAIVEIARSIRESVGSG